LVIVHQGFPHSLFRRGWSPLESEVDQLSFKRGQVCHKNSKEKMTEEKKRHKSSHFLKIEPEGIEVLIRDKAVVEAFKKVECWKFCKKLSGGNT